MRKKAWEVEVEVLVMEQQDMRLEMCDGGIL